jgi:hypothetical protein
LGWRQEGYPVVKKSPTPEMKVEKAFILHENSLTQALHGIMDVINDEEEEKKNYMYTS